MPDVRIVNVTKRFGKVTAVNNVSLNIRDKEYFSLLGPSGCGKTTLLRLIAGLIQPDEGEIYINDRLVNDVPPEDRDVGFVFQTFALFPHMNAWDNVTYGPRVKNFGAKNIETIGNEVLDMVKLHERLDAFPNELSGGMMQRIAVARALAAGAKLLLLDEPLGQLDAKIRIDLRQDIRKMAKDLGLTAVHVTHDQSEAMSISDKIAVMRKGKVLQIGAPQELYMNPNSIFVANFIGESNFLDSNIFDARGDEVVVELHGGIKVRVHGKNMSKGERVVLAIRPETFSIEKGEKKFENSISGTIERVIFEGTNIRYEVRLKNQDLIVIIRPSLIGEWINIGENVTTGFPSEKAYLFKYPEVGLREEMSVE